MVVQSDIHAGAPSSRTEAGNRRALTLVLLVAGLVAAEALMALGAELEQAPWWVHALVPTFFLIASIRCFLTATREMGDDKKAWTLFGAGLLGASIADCMWGASSLFLEVTMLTPSIADVGYLAFGVLFILGIWYYRTHLPSVGLTFVQIGNLAIILAAILLAYIFLFQELGQAAVSKGAVIVGAAYAIENLLAVSFALVSASFRVSGRKRFVMLLIFLGLSAYAATDFNFILSLTAGEYDVTSPLNGLYLLASAFLYWAAVEHDQLVAGDPSDAAASELEDRAAQWETLLPPLAIAGTLIVAFWYREKLTADLIPYVVGASVLFIAALTVRNWFGHRVESAALEVAAARSSELRTANRELRDEMNIRSRVEAELRHSNKMDASGQLTGGVADDFEGVLARVSEKLDQLRQNPAFEAEELRDIHSNIKRTAQRGTQLVRRLQSLSRKQAAGSQKISIGQILSEMREALELRLGGGVRMQIAASADLWPVLADRSQLVNAISNLVSNANDALSDGGSIWIEARNVGLEEARGFDRTESPVGTFVEIEVRDTGPGICREDVGQVFEPFFTTKAAGLGSGLGLTMVYSFAEQWGGHVTLESASGEGTAVRLRIPSYRSLGDPVRERE